MFVLTTYTKLRKYDIYSRAVINGVKMARSMVKSASIRRAQTQLLCQLCDNQGVVVKWKCEDCGIYMCDSCKVKIHIRFKSADEHEIISFREVDKNASVSAVVVSSIFNSYHTDVSAIHSLLCVDDDIVYYICNYPIEKSKFMKAKLLKASLKTLQSLDLPLFDICINNNQEILCTRFGTTELFALSSDGEVKSVVNASPMVLLSLHINKDNELHIGLREPGPAFPLTSFSIRQVIVLGDKYERKATFETDKSGAKLVSYPARICTDSKHVIYIADWTNADRTGRIVAVNRNGRIKFTYDGHEWVEKFWPFGIAVSQNDNIILSDHGNNMLHVLNPKGQLIGLQNFDDIDISQPYSLAIDTEGFLLIGCTTHVSEEANAKMYIVKMADYLI